MAASRLLRSALLIAGACAPAALLGCGASAARVTGHITINGQPPKLRGMGIAFMAPDGRSDSSAVAEDGSYSAERVPVGQVSVAFLYITPQAPQDPKGGSGKLPKPGAGDAPDTGRSTAGLYFNPIPQPLRDASTSKVTYQVQGGKQNVFNYDIKP
jgi:hypothetical protein